jgi:hypothetical protein
MIKLLADEKTVYHLHEHAIIENEDGTYEYVSWDLKTDKPSWIRGGAIILEDVLGLVSMASEGEEEDIETQLELKYELSQLPNWDKTRYYCVITGAQYGTLLKYCDTGDFVKKEEQDYEIIRKKLAAHRVTLFSE